MTYILVLAIESYANFKKHIEINIIFIFLSQRPRASLTSLVISDVEFILQEMNLNETVSTALCLERPHLTSLQAVYTIGLTLIQFTIPLSTMILAYTAIYNIIQVVFLYL